MRLFHWALRYVLPLVLLTASAFAAAPVRVVAVADVHGDLVHFKDILREAGIIDDQDHWIAGDTIMVQTGDLVDKGPDSRGVIELLMNLEAQAPKSGGKLISLLGNHEIMDMTGDLRYVSPEDWATFADANSPKRRDAALQQWKGWSKQHGVTVTPEMESEWMSHHPLGFFERAEAFGPRGRYGKWLRAHQVTVQVGDTMFMHGGLHPKLAGMSPNQINRRIADELHVFDRVVNTLVEARAILPGATWDEIVNGAQQAMTDCTHVGAPAGNIVGCETVRAELQPFFGFANWLSVHREGPVWFRGFAEWTDEEGAPNVQKLLQAQHVARFVVGHTYSGGRVRMRWDGKVYLIDTGLLQHPMYKEPGRGSALEIAGSRVTAIYADSKVVLVPAADSADGKAMPASNH